jgi:chromate transporter
MIYLELLLGFLRVGCFSFGGAYGAIPLIRDVVMGYGWMDDEALSCIIAISESTPGPIMVNLATYIGSSQGGFLGAVLATFAVVAPSFFVVLLVMAALSALVKNECFRTVLGGLKACVVGVILATGVEMLTGYLCPAGAGGALQMQAVKLAVILAVIWLPLKFLLKGRFSPVVLIAVSAVLGVFIY